MRCLLSAHSSHTHQVHFINLNRNSLVSCRTNFILQYTVWTAEKIGRQPKWRMGGGGVIWREGLNAGWMIGERTKQSGKLIFQSTEYSATIVRYDFIIESTRTWICQHCVNIAHSVPSSNRNMIVTCLSDDRRVSRVVTHVTIGAHHTNCMSNTIFNLLPVSMSLNF